MRTGHNKQRSRNRHRSSGGGGGSSGGGGGGNPLSRVYESNGPDVKVRGTAQTVADKYLQLGRDAQVSGDIVMAESYYQFAEHYLRIVAAAQAYNQQNQPQMNPPPQYRRPDDDQDDEGEDDGTDTTATDPRLAAQPVIDQQHMGGDQPRESEGERQPYQQQNRQNRDNRDRDRDRDNRDRDNRDQNGQPFNRDRNRNRWQDRRDQPQAQGGQPANGEQRQPSAQPRAETRPDEQPRDITPPPAPRVEVVAETVQWEAPSFLRRPAPLPAAEPVVEVASVAPPAPAPERKPRKPRKVAEPVAEAVVPAEPAAD